MSAPLYQLKAEFFKTLGHPARIRVLELLSEREHSVGEMLRAVRASGTARRPAHVAEPRRAVAGPSTAARHRLALSAG